ncbi:MAG: DUF664 domain-containing protein [Propionibacteriales bacterium]|nr:DUF664 domain-containing protein [Propionibacteriales bacterium]
MLADAYGRIRSLVHRSAEGLSGDELAYRPEADANSIAWLVWHLTRIQDDHVSELAGREQTWTAEGWHARFGVPEDPAETGHGHTSEQVAAVRPAGPDLLLGYHDAVADRTLEYLDTVDADELDRIVDHSYDPPVSAGVRLVSVLSDNLQHAGQARYIRGILERRE